MAKKLYIIAGPNGAGKTTASLTLLPVLNCTQWVNADEIAKGLSPFAPESVAVEAGRLMLQRIEVLLAAGESFAIETTLATRSYHKLVERAHALGYEVELIFFYLPSHEVSIKRVAYRVEHGGHNIPVEIIKRRYKAGLKNLRDIYMPIVDKWTIYDNYIFQRFVATGNKGTCVEIQDQDLFNKIMVKESSTSYLSERDAMMLDACRRGVINMLKERALHGDTVIMADGNGNPIRVLAQEILDKNPNFDHDVVYTPVE